VLADLSPHIYREIKKAEPSRVPQGSSIDAMRIKTRLAKIRSTLANSDHRSLMAARADCHQLEDQLATLRFISFPTTMRKHRLD